MNTRKSAIATITPLLLALLAGCDAGRTGGGKSGASGPPKVVGLDAQWSTGLFSYDLLLTNSSSSDLVEVELTITLYRIDGEKPVVKQFWANWSKGETKKVNVSSHKYQQVTLKGKAVQKVPVALVVIDDGWTWNWP